MNEKRYIENETFVKADGEVFYVTGVEYETEMLNLSSLADIKKHGRDAYELYNSAKSVPTATVEIIEPIIADEAVVRRFFRLEATAEQLAKDGLFPFSDKTGSIAVNEDDILTLIDNLSSVSLPTIYSWVDAFAPAENSHAVLPVSEDIYLTFLTDCLVETLNMINMCADLDLGCSKLEILKAGYMKSKGRPFSQIVLPGQYKCEMLGYIKEYASKHAIGKDMRDYYIKTLDTLAETDLEADLLRKAYAYYGGDGIAPCDFLKSESALLKLFEIYENEYAANSLGYIYASNRLGEPDYEKAFFYFSFAASRNVTEAIYKLSDLYKYGNGTEANPDKTWALISQLYENADKEHKSEGKFPDIALRMGYCLRDGIGTQKNPEKAMTFFLEAKEGIELRMKSDMEYGDEVVLKNILSAIESVKTA